MPVSDMDGEVSESQTRTRLQDATAIINSATQPQQPQEEVSDGSFDLYSAVSDISRGILTEVPRAVAYGGQEAVNEVLQSLDELDSFYTEALGLPDWLTTSIPVVGPTAGNLLRAGAAVGRTADEEGKVVDVVDPPETTTGQVMSSISQFVFGFVPALKAVRAAGAARTALGKFAQTEAAAAISTALVFDPHEERLSNLIESVPALSNPITRYLKAEDDDSTFEGRVKGALEGLGFGIGVEGVKGVVQGVKAIRANRRANNVDTPVEEALDTSPLVRELGDPNADLLIMEPAGSLGAAARPKAAAEGPVTIPHIIGRGRKRKVPFQYNWARMNTPEDIKQFIDRTAPVFAKRMDDARRGTISDKKLDDLVEGQLRELAGDTGLSPEDIFRIHGSGFRAEQILAMKHLTEMATEDALRLARVAVKSTDMADLAAFNRMKDIQASVFAYAQGAVSEAGRALRASQLPTGSHAKQLSDLSAAVSDEGGPDAIRRLASAYVEVGDMKNIDKVLAGSKTRRTKNFISKLWYHALLSGPRTHIVNVTSSASNFAWQTAERALAARIARVSGHGNSVAVGEASHMWFGALEGFNGMVRAVAKKVQRNSNRTLPRTLARNAARIVTEGPQQSITSRAGQKIDHQNVPINSKNYPIGDLFRNMASQSVPENPDLAARMLQGGANALAAIMDGTVNLVGSVIELPSQALMLEDEFFKTIGRSAEVHARAMREVSSQGLQGDEAERVFREIVNNPDSLTMESAEAFARDLTFTTPLQGNWRNFQMAVSNSLVGRLLIPFPRVSINLPTWAAKRTPLGYASAKIRSQIAAGGAEGDLALARMGLGTMLGMTAADLAFRGQVTGAPPFDRDLRRSWEQLHPPFSVRLGDTWYSYDRTDPFGLILGAAASYAQIAGDLSVMEREELAGALLLATTESVFNKTWLLGVTQGLDAIQDPEMSLDRFVQRTGGTFLVPTGVSQVRQARDPVWREVDSILQAAQARVPGYSQGLPPHRNFWGDKLLSQFGFGGTDLDIVPESDSLLDDTLQFANSFMPFSKFTPPDDPINVWLFENRVGIRMPARTQWGAELTPEQYSRFVELAGNAAKDVTGLGFKDTMNSLVEGTHPTSDSWARQTDGPKGGKSLLFKAYMGMFRDLARAQLYEEDTEFRGRVNAVLQEEATATQETNMLPRAGRAPR